jgi:hypothetical protein
MQALYHPKLHSTTLLQGYKATRKSRTAIAMMEAHPKYPVGSEIKRLVLDG